MEYKTYIQNLMEESIKIQNKTKEIAELDIPLLKSRPNKDAWNILECYEHLWYYSSLYGKNMRSAIDKAPALKQDFKIKHGFMGGKFIKMMNPDSEGKIKKMNTFKSKNPFQVTLERDSIQKFLQSNEETIKICEEALTKNTFKVKSQTAIPMLRLKLGDALGFIIGHNTRHMLQIEKCLSNALKA
jgi:hypothetical protein